MQHFNLKTAFVALGLTVSTAVFAEGTTPVLPNIFNKDLTSSPVEWTKGDGTDPDQLSTLLSSDEYTGSFVYNNEDYRDKEGFRHICYQQTDGTNNIEGKQIYVHMKKDGDKWMVHMITGDIYKAGSSAKPSNAKSTGNMPVPAGAQRVSIVENGQLTPCYVVREDGYKVYKEVGTDRIVEKDRLVHYAEKATTAKADCEGNRFYYNSNGIKSDALKFTAATVDGKTVLQNPGKVYTLDFTEFFGSEGYKQDFDSLAQCLAAGKNFEGADESTIYATELGHNKTVIKNFKINANVSQLTFEKWTIGGESATASKTLTGTYKETAGTTTFTVGDDDKDFFTFDIKSREIQTKPNTTDGEKEYIKVSDGTNTAYLPIQNCSNQIALGNNKLNINKESISLASAIDVHWGLERTLAMYEDAFGLNSFDGKGTPVLALVNWHQLGDAGFPDNATGGSSTGNGDAGVMSFGLGQYQYDGQKMDGGYPQTDLETIGHEFTHLVASKLAGNTDANALNESYADIMGKKVERLNLVDTYKYADDNNGDFVKYVSWRCSQIAGLGAPQQACRYSDNPSMHTTEISSGEKVGDPKFYEGTDWGKLGREEHRDAGVQNYWFYLLCNGGNIVPEKGNPVAITAIDRTDAEFVTFSALKYFSTKYTNYPMARANSLAAAKLIWGENSQQYKTVGDAWYAVGVNQDAWTSPTATTAVDIKTTESGVASFVATKDLDFSSVEGLTAYVATETSENSITLAKATKIPTDKAFVVKGEPSTTYHVTIATEAPTLAKDLFEGSATATKIVGAEDNIYALAKTGTFKKINKDVVIPAGKAYISLPSSGHAKELILNFEGATAIQEVNAGVNADNDRKFIENGHIVIVKNGMKFNAAGQRIF